MSNSIIPVFTGSVSGETTQLVNARELHAFLESKQQYSNWIQNQIETFDFTQDIDFIVINNFVNDATAFGGKRKIKDYHITLDMAKELSMVERNAKGKQARLYFIDCEKQAKSQPIIDPMKALSDPATMRTLLLGYTEKVIELESKVEEQNEEISILEPKAQALDRLENSDGTLNVTEASKVLKVKRDWLFSYLNSVKWIYRSGGNWLGYTDKEQQGLVKNDTKTVNLADGTKRITVQVRITAKGLTKLSAMLNPPPTLLDRAISMVTGKRNGLVAMKGGAK